MGEDVCHYARQGYDGAFHSSRGVTRRQSQTLPFPYAAAVQARLFYGEDGTAHMHAGHIARDSGRYDACQISPTVFEAKYTLLKDIQLQPVVEFFNKNSLHEA